MGSKTPATQTVTNKTEVDPTTAAWQKALFNQGSQLYGQGPSEYYPGSTVVPYAQQTLQGLDMLQSNAQQGAVGLPQAYDASMRAMSGYTPGMNTAMLASQGGMTNPFTGAIWNAANQSTAPQVAGQIGMAGVYGNQVAQAGQAPTTMGVDALQGFSDAQNPYLDQLFQQGAEKVRNSVNAQFSGAGRTGANAAHTGALTAGLSDLYTGIYAPAYESAQNRSLSAAGQLAGIDQADRAAEMSGYGTAASLGLQGAGLYGDFLNTDAARRYQGATDLAGLSESGFDRRLQGSELAGSLWSQGNTDAARASALLPSLYQYGEMPGQSMVGVGGAYEALSQQYLDDAMNRWNYGQNADWENLQRYASLMSGLPSFTSSTQTTSGGAGQNRAMGALGGAASGASMGSMFGPWGTAIGAGVGGLFGLFG